MQYHSSCLQYIIVVYLIPVLCVGDHWAVHNWVALVIQTSMNQGGRIITVFMFVCVCVCVCVVEKGSVQFTVHSINRVGLYRILLLQIVLLLWTYKVCSVESVSFGGSIKCDCDIFSVIQSCLYIPLMAALEYFLLFSSPVQTDTDTMMMTSSTTQSKLTITGKWMMKGVGVDTVGVDTSGIGIVEVLGVAGVSVVLNTVGVSVDRSDSCDVHNDDCIFLPPPSSVAHVWLSSWRDILYPQDRLSVSFTVNKILLLGLNVPV